MNDLKELFRRALWLQGREPSEPDAAKYEFFKTMSFAFRCVYWTLVVVSFVFDFTIWHHHAYPWMLTFVYFAVVLVFLHLQSVAHSLSKQYR